MQQYKLPDSPEKVRLMKHLNDQIEVLNQRIALWAGTPGLEFERTKLLGQRDAYEAILDMIR